MTVYRHFVRHVTDGIFYESFTQSDLMGDALLTEGWTELDPVNDAPFVFPTKRETAD